jgi:membrane-associated phospholipid phosphatase
VTSRQTMLWLRHEMPGRLAAIIVVAALPFVLATAAVASTGEVPDWEADALRFVNGWPDQLEPVMWLLQQAGVLGAPVAAGVAIAAIARRWQYAVPFLLLVPIKLGIEWLFLKQLIERGRPYETIGPEIEVRGPAFEGLSYPSGHSTTAMAFAILLLAFLPRRWWPVPIAWALMVGVARLYYGEHNVLDVVGGLAIGTVYGTVVWYAVLDRFADGGGAP